MNRNAPIFSFLILALAACCGCSSQPAATESKKAETAPDRIQGKTQVLEEEPSATETAMNLGGPSLYILEGERRYRLFLRTAPNPAVVPGGEYVAEGIDAQKAIDEIGDPDQGKNGYPLQSSCERVVQMAWKGLPFDAVEAQGAVLRARVKRYPARTVFLVARLRPATSADISAASKEPKKDAEDKNVPEVSVAADKQKAFLTEGSPVQPAPLWEPAGGTVSCKVVISPEGKISELESGAQLCETVKWSKFRYQPPVQGGHPVKVKTEVEVRFEPRK